MARTYATEAAGFGTTPETKADGGIHGGRLRRFRASFTMAAQASGDDIVLAKIPAGYRFAFGIINASATMGNIIKFYCKSMQKEKSCETHDFILKTIFLVICQFFHFLCMLSCKLSYLNSSKEPSKLLNLFLI